MCCSTYERSLAFAEDLPLGFSGISPDALEIAKALRIIIDGDLANGKYRKLGCPPGYDPDTEFFFGTDQPDLCKAVGEAMATLPGTRSSTHEVSFMPYYQSLVPFNTLWDTFLGDLASAAEKGVHWRDKIRSLTFCVGSKPEVSRVEKC